MSPILPNMSTGNALNLPILSSAPMCLGRSGPPRSSFFGVLGRVAHRTPLAPSPRRLIQASMSSHSIRLTC